MEQIVNGLRDILQYVIGLAGLVAVGFILYGGFKYMSSRDDPRAVAGARTTLINATIGLILAVMAFPLTNWVIDRVAPDAARVSDVVLEPVVIVGVQLLGGEKNHTSSGATTRTVQVEFSERVCVEGQGSNLKLRTDRGSMDLLEEGTGAINVVDNNTCSSNVASQVNLIPFQIKNPASDANTTAWLEKLTITAITKGGSVNIVSPSEAPVNEALTTTYNCDWGTGATAKGAGTPCS